MHRQCGPALLLRQRYGEKVIRRQNSLSEDVHVFRLFPDPAPSVRLRRITA